MKKTLLILSLFLVACFVSAQKVYQVKSGDTLYNISKTHNVSIEELYEMNPSLEQNGLRVDDEIILSPLSQTQKPNGKLVYTTVPETSKVKSDQYQVQKGDTLYAISKKLGTSMDELMEINEGLTPENLKVGQILKVVKPSNSGKTTTQQNNTSNPNEVPYYTVVKGDTFYSLTKRFKTDEATLKAYNPILVNGLKVGQQIYFPEVDKGFITHKVKKGETIFSIVRKYNVSLAILLEHNPDLKNGLKAGMDLKIPVETVTEEKDDYFNLVYILPFNSEDYQSSEKRSMTTTEFYMGSLFALDSLAKKGKKIRVKTYDNKATLKETQAIVERIDFDQVDLIIGPLRSSNAHWVADYVKDKNIKVISPFSGSIDVTHRQNLIKASLTQDVLVEELSHKIRVKNQWDSIFVIGNDNPDLRPDLKEIFKNSYLEQITSIKEYDFTTIPQKSTIVLNTINPSVAKAALNKMHDAKVQDQMTGLFAIGYNAAYVKANGVNEAFVGNEILKNLGLVALIPNYFNDTKQSIYHTKYNYRKENQAFPDNYSSAGFDWTYYMILNDEYKNPKQVQEGLFNTIDLKKVENGGYINKGLFVVKY